MVIAPMIIGAGFILGVLVGRWWALAPAAALGVWIGIVSEVEVSGWFLGFMYGVVGCLSIGTGVVVRRAIHRLSRTA
jgi:hypothetical protein